MTPSAARLVIRIVAVAYLLAALACCLLRQQWEREAVAAETYTNGPLPYEVPK